MNYQVPLYIIAGVTALLPVFFLIGLHQRHKYRFVSVIVGIAAYFLAIQVLMNALTTCFSYFGMGSDFWADHKHLQTFLNIVFSMLFENMILYLLMRFALKKSLKVYDALAVGISYWFEYSFMFASYAVSYGRLSSMNAKGRLEEMVSGNVTMESLQQSVAFLEENGMKPFLIQMFNIFVLMAMTAAVCLLFYHSIKRKNAKFLLYGIGANTAAFTLLEVSEHYLPDAAYVVVNAAVLVLSLYFIYRYFRWYRLQQIALMEKRKAYREGLRSVVPSKRETEDITDIEEEENDLSSEEDSNDIQ